MADEIRFDEGRFLTAAGAPASAEIIPKELEKILVLDARTALVYPLVVPDWLDIRIGVFLSLTQAVDFDSEDLLAETLTTTGLQQDRLWLGFKSNEDAMPRDSNFFGISNSPAVEATGSSVLESISSNTRWRVKYASSTAGLAVRAGATFNVDTTMHPFRTIQDPTVIARPAGGADPYSSLVLLRMVRTAIGATIDHFYVSKTIDGANGGLTYADVNVDTDLPANELILENMASTTWSEVFSAKSFDGTPDTAFYAYWPFNNSRLRIHNVLAAKFA